MIGIIHLLEIEENNIDYVENQVDPISFDIISKYIDLVYIKVHVQHRIATHLIHLPEI